MTRNERRKLASQILSNSSLLAIALEERDLYPDWRASVSRDLGERLRLPLRMFVGEAEAIDSRSTDEQLGMFAATILSELLEGLEDGVRGSGRKFSTACQAKPSECSTAAFLRETAAWTKARFGKPLWDVVLALASIHFNCDDLDADSVRLIVSRASHPSKRRDLRFRYCRTGRLRVFNGFLERTGVHREPKN